MEKYIFTGKWITNKAFALRKPRNVFHRQLETFHLEEDEMQNSHILFRKKFSLNEMTKSALMYITADDYYKLYINGQFVGQGPAPSYHKKYNYNVIDVSKYLVKGENTLAVHTYYQGLINRVWQSGDFRHGLMCDLVVDGKTVLKSDESFVTHMHTGYGMVDVIGFQKKGIVGYDTQFLECYDSRAGEVGFENPDFDDSNWEQAQIYKYADYMFVEQPTKMLEFERIQPVNIEKVGNVLHIDFGGMYVGYLFAKAQGSNGEKIIIRLGQELNDDGSVRNEIRSNCNYVDEWILSGKTDTLMQYDYKSFRYVEMEAPMHDTKIFDIQLIARHYPFTLKANLAPEYANNPDMVKIWELCVHTQKYGVQEVIQDCMDREKGFYLGDGCYSVLCNYVLTGDDSMMRRLIDEAFFSSFITDGLVTCMDCSFVQEIAEFPLILMEALLWHYRLSKDMVYLKENYFKAVKVLDFYKENYEKDHILCNLDKWCVVEWPPNYRDGYAVDIQQGVVCREPHVSINAYYLRAICILNEVAKIIGEKPYREEKPLKDSFMKAFYDEEKHLFCDGIEHRHISLIGNSFPYGFSILENKEFEQAFLALLEKKGYAALSFFTAFPVLCGFVRRGEWERVKNFICDEGTWNRMLKEGATATFEGWGQDVKWNTSLFHLTMTFAAIFLSDVTINELFSS